jgi:hypothetical protein
MDAGDTTDVLVVGCGIIGASIAFVTEGVGFAILVVLAMTAVQQLDGHLMTPLIMGRTVRVHPLAVLLVVLIAGVLYGVFGMLVAVPLVAGAKVLAQHVWQTRVPWAEPPDRSPPGGDATEVVDGTANGESDVPLADTGLTRELPEWESVER